jgi:hypothetical protein
MACISRRLPVFALCTLLGTASSGSALAAGSPAEGMAFRSPLTSVGVVQELDAVPDPDDPRKGGGFDAEGYFQNIVIANVSECTANVLKVFTTWSSARSLSIAKSTQTPTSALAFVIIAAPAGVLQLDYRFHSDTKRSRATLFYFSNDGSKHEPSALQAMLTQYDIASLQDSIRTAVACN